MSLQVRTFQEWRATLWALCHGAVIPAGSAAAQGPSEDVLAFVWLRLMRCVDAISASVLAACGGTFPQV